MHRTATVLMLVGALALSSCGSGGTATVTSSKLPTGQPGQGKPAVTIGTKNFTEQVILGQLYTQALRAKGFTINLKPGIGPTEVVSPALIRGLIDMYPEYTGVIVSVVQAMDTLAVPGGSVAGSTQPPRTPQEAYDIAKKYEASLHFAMLNMTPFYNTDVIVTTQAFARKHDLTSLGDLKRLKSFTNAGPPENATRYQGVLGMRQAYGLTNAIFVPMKIGTQYAALDSGKVETIAGFTTDPQLGSDRYVELADPKNIFGFQNVAPVIAEDVLEQQGPDFARTLNAVSATLTTPAMRRLNAQVVLDKRSPAEVAKQFLASNGLN